MDGRQRPRMPCVQKLQQVESFATTNFANDEAIRAMPECRFQQIAYRDGRKSVLFAPGFKSDEILLRQPYLGRVFDDKNALFLRNEFPEDRQESCFARTGASADEDILASENVVF